MSLDINLIRGILTALLLVSFIGLCIWAWSRHRHAAFSEAANLPFVDDEISLKSSISQEASPRATGERSL